jgi:hypothetical protein
MNKDQLDRFWEKVATEPNTGCWLWTGAWINTGYGWFKTDESTRLAHRVSYIHYVGEIPEGMDLDHLCRVRCCVNPQHLEPVSRSENNRRGLVGTWMQNFQAKKTHCPQGHPYSGRDKKGRICHTCKAVRERKRQAKMRAERGH